MSGDEEYEFEEVSPLRAAALSAHELYITLKEAGFSRRDSIELLAKILIGTIHEVMTHEDDEE